MGIFDRFTRKEIKPDPMLRSIKIGRNVGKRYYSAGLQDRLTADFSSSRLSANEEIKAYHTVMVSRSRELERNNDYVRKFFRMVEQNVIGPEGIKLQVAGRDPDGTLDKQGNRIVEAAWRDWGKPGNCTMDGRMSWIDAQNMFVRNAARDGEALVQIVRDSSMPYRMGLAFWENDYLDVEKNELRNGNRVIMSVEVDQWDKPVAFWFLTEHPGANTFFDANTGRSYRRVPAEDIIHSFVINRAGQVRGVPWIHTAIRRLKMLGGYEEAELVASRVAASKMGFYTTPDGDSYVADEELAGGGLVNEASPGMFEQLPEGTTFQTFDPTHPTSQVPDFIKSMLRGIASGMGVSYNTLANDLEGVNFSSLRQGNLDERDAWKMMQRWVIDHLHSRIFPIWLENALNSDRLALPPTDRAFQKFNNPVWQPRGWQWVDPQKEVLAQRSAIRAGITSLQQVIREQGRDPETILDDIRELNQFLDENDMVLDIDPRHVTSAGVGQFSDPLALGEEQPENTDDGNFDSE